MEPKVSVIIPIYNVGEYLNKTVRSVVNQTLREIEIVLVDDGSVDNSPSMVDEWSQKDTRIIPIHKTNGGVTSARNTGLQKAIGEYVFFLDGDDYILPHSLEVLYAEASANSADWVVSDFIIEYPDGSQLEKRFPDFGRVSSSGFLAYSYSNSDFYYTGRLIRASFLKMANLRIPEEITFGEDNLCVTQLGAQLDNAIKVNTTSLVYVQRQSSVTNKLKKEDLHKRAQACHLSYNYLSSLSCFDKIKPMVDSYFIKEYCSCIARGYIAEEMTFVHKECHYYNSRLTPRERFFYLLSLINKNASIFVYRYLKKAFRKMN